MVHVAGGGCAQQGGAELGSDPGSLAPETRLPTSAPRLCPSALLTSLFSPLRWLFASSGPCTALTFASRLCLTVKLRTACAHAPQGGLAALVWRPLRTLTSVGSASCHPLGTASSSDQDPTPAGEVREERQSAGWLMPNTSPPATFLKKT